MSRPTILIVDDDSATRHLIGEILRSHNAELEYANDGADALACVGESVPDLILLDIALPRVDGWQVLDALQRDSATCRVPIIVITAHGQGTAAERALSGGAISFFEKPFLPSELAKAVDKVLQPTVRI